MKRPAGKSLEPLPGFGVVTAPPAEGFGPESEAEEPLVFVAESEPAQRAEVRSLSLQAGSEAT